MKAQTDSPKFRLRYVAAIMKTWRKYLFTKQHQHTSMGNNLVHAFQKCKW